MRKFITNFSYNLKYKNYKNFFNEVNNNVYKSLEELEYQQNQSLEKIIKFSFDKVDYYRNLSKQIGITASDIHTKEDLVKLPILEKNIIKATQEKFYSEEKRIFKSSSTGGSTGIPLKYRIDKESSMYGRAINDRGWGYAGYKAGDHVVFFAGGSLVNKTNFKKKILNSLSNFTCFSSYGVDDEKLYTLFYYLQRKKPKFMYCYASSAYFLALFLEKNNLKLDSPPIAIFTTSEKILPYQRKKINEIINTQVFDAYGMNDGGVSAHECECHDGMHIDFERSILEVVDDEGNQLREGKGRVIATTLNNYAMPFIRYDTGDIAVITHKPCKCGRTTPRIMEIVGRTTDYLKFGNTLIGSPVLTVLMGKLDVDLYQIIQDKEDHVLFKLVLPMDVHKDTKKHCVNHIKSSMYDKVPNVKVDVEFFDSVEKLGSINKHKFIINELLE